MKTFPSCIACLFNQLNRMVKLHGIDSKTHHQMAVELAKAVPIMNLDETPPELSRHLHDILIKHTGNHDPYKELKILENKRAKEILPQIRRHIENSKNSFHTAVRYAAAANVIDYGTPKLLEIEKTMENLADREFECFDIEILENRLRRAKTVLVLGDNTGEVFYDRLLIEYLPTSAKIYYAVRSKPVINDVLIEDAYEAGIDEVATLMESGSKIPGTIPSLCSDDFQRLYKKADVIISKGQGNFETLSEEKYPIIFLFAIKCEAVSGKLGFPVASLMVKAQDKYNWQE